MGFEMSILDIFSCVPERELSCAKIEEIAVSLEKGDYCRREEFPCHCDEDDLLHAVREQLIGNKHSAHVSDQAGSTE